jgi:hypothetical protein
MKHGSKRAKKPGKATAQPQQRDTRTRTDTQQAIETREQKDIRVFNRFRISAYVGILIVSGIVAFLNHANSMWFPPRMGDNRYLGQFVLLCVLILLAIRWVYATDKEFRLWTRVLENPIEKWDAYAAIVSLSLVMGFCLAYAFDLVKVSMAFTGFLLINYWSQWQANDHFSHALSATREQTTDRARQNVLNVMESYWLKKPQLARINTMMFFSSMAFSLAWAGSFLKEPQKNNFELAATVILIGNIVVAEIFIGIWRYQRNREKALAERLNSELKLTEEEEQLATAADEGNLHGLKIGAYLGIFGIAVSINVEPHLASWIAAVSSGESASSWLLIARYLFFFQVLILSFTWIWATTKELRIWLKYFDNPLDKAEVTVAIIALSLALGALLGFSFVLLFISFAFTLYFLLNYWTQWLSNDHFRRAMKKPKKPLEDVAVLTVLERYWLERPQMFRIAAMMFFASLAFSLALAGWVQQEPQRTKFYLASYALLFLDIMVGEIFIFSWRRDRDNDIKDILLASKVERQSPR